MNSNQRQTIVESFRANPQLVGWVLASSTLSGRGLDLTNYLKRSDRHLELEREAQRLAKVADVRWSDLQRVSNDLVADPSSKDFAFKYAFIGLKLAGKSTASTVVSNILGCQAVDTSDMIYERLAAEMGITLDELRTLPKEEIRPKLIEIGDRLSKTDPLALIRPVLDSKSFTIAGIRKKDQLEALPKEVQVVWINREGHAPDSLDNLEIEPDGHCIVINNGESMIEFRYVLCDLVLGIHEEPNS